MRALVDRSVFASSILLVFSTFVFAQQTGTIRGTVTDSFGAVVPDATVEVIKNSARAMRAGLRKVGRSNFEGQYEVPDLPSGTYTVSARWFGMVFEKQNVRVGPSSTVNLDVGLSYEANCSSKSSDEYLSNRDRAEILNQVLARFLSHPGYRDLIDPRGYVIVSNANIDPAWITSTSNVRLQFLKPSEIQQKADGGADFEYVSIGKWTSGMGCAVISASDVWAAGKHSELIHMSGGGLYFMFTKQQGKWVGELLGEWVV